VASTSRLACHSITASGAWRRLSSSMATVRSADDLRLRCTSSFRRAAMGRHRDHDATADGVRHRSPTAAVRSGRWHRCDAACRPGHPGRDRPVRFRTQALAGCTTTGQGALRLRCRRGIAHGVPAAAGVDRRRAAVAVFVARLDLAYPKHRLGVEYEGDHHRSRDTFQRDLRRINALHACGWTVLRFGAADVYRQPGRIVEVVKAALPGTGPSRLAQLVHERSGT